jgi:hypothetical protein
MKIEVKQLMDDNEMLSHIFLGCIPADKLIAIRDKFVGEKDWRTESVKIPIELKIGGVAVNPKAFFDSWRDQMQDIIKTTAQKIVAEKLGSAKMQDMQEKLYEFEQVLKSWESDINWDMPNPLIDKIEPLNDSTSQQ